MRAERFAASSWNVWSKIFHLNWVNNRTRFVWLFLLASDSLRFLVTSLGTMSTSSIKRLKTFQLGLVFTRRF